MSERRKRVLPSPALVVASIALIVSLSGTAVAAGIVANARHANRADVAIRALGSDKLQGKTASQIAAAGAAAGAQLPGPASSAAGLVSLKTQSGGQIAPNQLGTLVISCDGGAKALSAGYSSDAPGDLIAFEQSPSSDTTWTLRIINLDDKAAHSVTLYAVCLK